MVVVDYCDTIISITKHEEEQKSRVEKDSWAAHTGEWGVTITIFTRIIITTTLLSLFFSMGA